jgi:hypothetical protein
VNDIMFDTDEAAQWFCGRVEVGNGVVRRRRWSLEIQIPGQLLHFRLLPRRALALPMTDIISDLLAAIISRLSSITRMTTMT